MTKEIKLPLLPEWAKMDNLGDLVPSEIRQELVAYATQAVEAHTAQQPLSEREIELIDGMIEMQLDHGAYCDTILSRPNGNHQMAEKQKGWDMERVTLLRKLKAAHGIGGEK